MTSTYGLTAEALAWLPERRFMNLYKGLLWRENSPYRAWREQAISEQPEQIEAVTDADILAGFGLSPSGLLGGNQ